MTKTLVLGIGNTLLGDEGVGVHALQTLQVRVRELSDVVLLDGGTLSFTLAGAIEAAGNLIVIDAAELQAAPGTVRLYSGAEMDRFVGSSRKRSVHEVSLIDLLAIAQLTDGLPANRALVAVQPRVIDWSHELSESVQRALPLVGDLVLQLILNWRAKECHREAQAQQTTCEAK